MVNENGFLFDINQFVGFQINSPEAYLASANALCDLPEETSWQINTPLSILLKEAWTDLNPPTGTKYLGQKYTDRQIHHRDLLLGYWKAVLLTLAGKKPDTALTSTQYNRLGLVQTLITPEPTFPPLPFSYSIRAFEHTTERAVYKFTYRLNPKSLSVDFGGYFPEITTLENYDGINFNVKFRRRRLTYIERTELITGVDGPGKVVKRESLQIAPY